VGIKALGKLGDKRATNTLLALMHDADHYDRIDILSALVQIRSEVAFDTLVNALRDEHPAVQQKAILLLGSLGDPRAVTPILNVLEDTDYDINLGGFVIIYALAQLGTEGIDGLVSLLEHNKERIRMDAAYFLGEVGGEKAIEALERAKQDTSEQVRSEVYKALQKLKQ
jgi:HEAT repeat protein